VSLVSQPGRVLAVTRDWVAAPPNLDYRAGPNAVLVDYGECLVLYGHVSPQPLPPVGQEVQPGAVVARTGKDEDGFAHLHLELIVKDPQWDQLPEAERPKTRAGNIRTNPVPHFAAAARRQLDRLAKIDGFHPNSGKLWLKPDDQPDITPCGEYLFPDDDADRDPCGRKQIQQQTQQ